MENSRSIDILRSSDTCFSILSLAWSSAELFPVADGDGSGDTRTERGGDGALSVFGLVPNTAVAALAAALLPLLAVQLPPLLESSSMEPLRLPLLLLCCRVNGRRGDGEREVGNDPAQPWDDLQYRQSSRDTASVNAAIYGETCLSERSRNLGNVVAMYRYRSPYPGSLDSK